MQARAAVSVITHFFRLTIQKSKDLAGEADAHGEACGASGEAIFYCGYQ